MPRGVGDKRGFLAGVLLTAVSLLATGLATDITLLALLRVVAGAAGALSLVTGGALASAAGGGGRGRPALALGVYFGGAGFGMVVSAFAVPALVAAIGWRSGWFALGALGLLGAAAALPALARAPAMAVHGAAAAGNHRSPRDARTARGAGELRAVRRRLHRLHDIHRCLSAQQPRLRPRPRSRCSGAAPALPRPAPGIVWGPLLARMSGGRGVAAANAVVTLGAILPVLLPTREAAYARPCCSAVRS